MSVRSNIVARSLGVLTFLLILFMPPCWGVEPPHAWMEEFAGPFPSWKNIKADYGAVGDGRADDTEPIQKALTELQTHHTACVLYFPAGTYRITNTVRTVRKAHTDGMGISVVGEDPATTRLRWDGPAGGTIVQYDAWYSSIRRLTLDGAGKAGTALAYGDAFSTYNETADMVFRDVDVGMQMATADNGQAENAVMRCRFLHCARAGLTTVNFNSMDIWAWYCRFEECGYGLYNGAGNFHVYQCLFLRSKQADIGTRNLMVFSFINNTSLDSHCFLDFRTGHTWGSPCSVTGNRILDPETCAIRLSNGGPYLVMDNVIRSRPGDTGPAVEMTWGDQTMVGNTYTVPQAVKEAGRFRRIAEKVVDPSKIDATLPTLPSTPVNPHRKVFEVPAGADAATLQKAIDAVARLHGQRPIVHLPMGIYKLDHTLMVPAGSDLQLIGDGAAETATVLRWTGQGAGPMLKLAGPARAVVRDLFLDAGRGTGLQVENCDQPGGLIHGCQVNLQGRSEQETPQYGLLVNGIEQSDAQFLCQQGGSCGTWVGVIGGAHPGPGQIGVYTGATGTSEAQYTVRHGGRLVVRSVYHEVSGRSPQGILLQDSGSLSIDATRFSYNTTAERPLVKLDGFRGDFGLFTELLLPVDSQHSARIETSGNGKEMRVLCMDDLFWQNGSRVDADQVWHNGAVPPAQAALLLCNQNLAHADATAPGSFAVLANRGQAEDAFILRMLQPLRRARIRLPEMPPPGVTGLLLHRLICTTGKDGIGVELRAAKAP